MSAGIALFSGNHLHLSEVDFMEKELRISEHPVLDFSPGDKVQFWFEGEPVTGYLGEPVAAALHAAGIRVLRYSRRLHRPRGFYCAIGNCSECLVEIDGEPNVRSCITPLAEGMRIRRQAGEGRAIADS